MSWTDDTTYTPTDLDVLRMENDLLAHEIRFLRARLRDPDQAARDGAFHGPRAKQLEQAEIDLVALLRRMSSSRMAWFFRRRDAFRTLESRYLAPDKGKRG